MTNQCYNCDKKLNDGYFCDDKCKDEYWEKGLKERGVKPHLPISEIQKRLIQMGKESKYGRRTY